MPGGFVVGGRADSTLRIYLCCLGSHAAGGYCGALAQSKVNSSLTPIHYGPLVPPSRSAALRHSQAPAFTHNVNHSGRALRHKREPRLPGGKHYLCVCVFFSFFKCNCIRRGRAEALEDSNEAVKPIAGRQQGTDFVRVR